MHWFLFFFLKHVNEFWLFFSWFRIRFRFWVFSFSVWFAFAGELRELNSPHIQLASPLVWFDTVPGHNSVRYLWLRMIIRPWSHDRSQRNAQNCRFVSKSPPFHPAQRYPWSWATWDASAAPRSRAACAWFFCKIGIYYYTIFKLRMWMLLTCRRRRRKHNTRAQRSGRVWQEFRRVIS